MHFNQQIRVIFALIIVLSILIGVAAVLFVTESAVSLWANLESVSPWVFFAYLAILILFAGVCGWFVWRLLVPTAKPPNESKAQPLTRESIDAQLEKAQEKGTDVSDAVQELQGLSRRREVAKIFIAFYGDISVGKSAIIRALIPELNIPISVTGGTTQDITQYEWCSPAGDTLNLIDMPGTNDLQQETDQFSHEEAQRAHIVVYVCEGDLNRTQFNALQSLLAMQKPLVVAVNKTDRYSEEDLSKILQRLRERLSAWPSVDIVSIQAGGVRQIVRQSSDGNEETIEQTITPNLQALQQALQNCIDNNTRVLDELRDAAVFLLVQDKLDKATKTHLREKAEETIQQYTRKAVVGALAAVSPGMDVLFQGYLGINLVKELCRLYDAPAKEVDLERFIKLVEAQSGKTLPLVLALAGNTLKAFPGIGTVVGGLTHAVAYGLIFDTLGRAVARTLESRGSLQTQAAITIFKEGLGENLETRAKRMVELATEIRNEKR